LSAVAIGLYQRLKRPKVTTENIESKVREWVDAFGWSTKKISDDSFYFGFEIRLKNNFPLALVRPRDHAQYLTLLATVAVDPEQKQIWEQLSPADQNTFRRELSLELAKAKIGNIANLPNTITIEKLMPITETLTEASLVNAIQEVQFAMVLVGTTVTLGLERRKKPDQ